MPFFELELGLMPRLEYTASAWLLRLACIAVAFWLWRVSIRGYRKNKCLIPEFIRFIAGVMLFIGCMEVDFIEFRCEGWYSEFCTFERREMYIGILGVHIVCMVDEEGNCYCPDPNEQVRRVLEVRRWGGFIPFLPCHGKTPEFLQVSWLSNYMRCQSCGSLVSSLDIKRWQDYLDSGEQGPFPFPRRPDCYDHRPKWDYNYQPIKWEEQNK